MIARNDEAEGDAVAGAIHLLGKIFQPHMAEFYPEFPVQRLPESLPHLGGQFLSQLRILFPGSIESWPGYAVDFSIGARTPPREASGSPASSNEGRRATKWPQSLRWSSPEAPDRKACGCGTDGQSEPPPRPPVLRRYGPGLSLIEVRSNRSNPHERPESDIRPSPGPTLESPPPGDYNLCSPERERWRY